jgi:hypothetical protein
MNHKTEIDYPGGFDALAENLGNLTYDSLGVFLEKLAAKLEKDAAADAGRERKKLSKQLRFAAKYIRNAWKICEPYMDLGLRKNG